MNDLTNEDANMRKKDAEAEKSRLMDHVIRKNTYWSPLGIFNGRIAYEVVFDVVVRRARWLRRKEKIGIKVLLTEKV